MKTILLRSSWQTINIGDIAHTPGMLALLQRYLPETEVILWASSVDNGVAEMLEQAFPKLKRIVTGDIESGEVQKAFAESNFFLHGSGPSVLAEAHMNAWREQTQKPYGVYGVTVGAVSESLHLLLSGADFVYCRDTISLEVGRVAGVTCPIVEFAPDATFACPLRDDISALMYLSLVGLRPGQFLCAIPRLRYTPYHKLGKSNWSAEWIAKVEATNAETKERDHAKMRGVIIRWVRETGCKVLACPEMTYEIPIAKELLIDPLPDDVRSKVVWRDTYWRPDEAASVYAQAHSLLSFEMHSPILAAVVGTPAFYLRQPTDTSKGQMWRDIGLADWIFEIDETESDTIAERLLEIRRNEAGADAKVHNAMALVRERQQQTMAVVRQSVYGKGAK
jgi:hypothetical protein